MARRWFAHVFDDHEGGGGFVTLTSTIIEGHRPEVGGLVPGDSHGSSDKRVVWVADEETNDMLTGLYALFPNVPDMLDDVIRNVTNATHDYWMTHQPKAPKKRRRRR